MEGRGLVLLLICRCALAALPTTFYTTSYDLTVTISSDVTVNGTVMATAQVVLICAQDTSNLTLHWGSSLVPSTPNSTTITSVIYNGNTFSLYNVTKDDTLDMITIIGVSCASNCFSKGKEISINMDYEITVNEETKGIFLRNFPNNDGTNGSILATNAWPTHARDILPCLDEPGYNATWTLEITRPSSWGVPATSFNYTGSTQSSDNSTTTDAFAATVDLPTSALSFFLNVNKSMTSTNYTRDSTSTILSFWTGEDLSAESTSLTNNMSFLAEMYYQIDDLLDTNFTLTDGLVNIVIVPNLEAAFGGLGILFIREDSYYGPYSNAQSEGLLKTRVVPVLRQMLKLYSGFSTWPQTWSDAWITEAVSAYLEYLVLNIMGFPFDFASELEVVARQTALALDTSGSEPLQDTTVNVNSSAAILASVTDPLKRTKGAALLNTLDMSLPAGVILSTIQSLLAGRKGMSVNTTYFSQLIRNTTLASRTYLTNGTKAALENIPLWFNTSGYPLINVTSATAGYPGNVSLLMSTFCGSSSCSSSLPEFYVSATVGSESEPRYLVTRQDLWVTNSSTGTSDSLDILSGDWVVANMRAAGYYRATYNSTLWERAVAAVALGLDEPPGRSQLIDDAFALSAAGLLDYNTTLYLAIANLQETLYSNWYPIHSGLWDLRDKLWNTDLYSTFKTYMTALLENVDSLLKSYALDSYQRSRIFSLFLEGMCEMDISNYRTYAKGNLTTFLQGDLPTNVVSSSYDAMVCCGARYNTSLNASTLWTTVTNFTASYYSKHYNAVALGCLANFTDIASLSTSVVETSSQYSAYVGTTFMYLAEYHPVNLTTNLSVIAEALETKLGASTVASIILKAGKKLNSTQATDLSTALNATSVDDVIKNAGGKVLSAVSLKTSWLSSYNSSVSTALQSNIATAKSYTSAATSTSSFTLLWQLPVLILVLSMVGR